MFLHVGGDQIVRLSDVVAIVDRRAVDFAAATREFLGFMGAEGRVEDVAGGEVKSLVVCTDRVVLSSISVGTLLRRAGVLNELIGEPALFTRDVRDVRDVRDARDARDVGADAPQGTRRL